MCDQEDSNRPAQLQRLARLKILGYASIGILLSTQRITKALIRLRGCAGCSALLLFAYGIIQVFSWRGQLCNFERHLNLRARVGITSRSSENFASRYVVVHIRKGMWLRPQDYFGYIVFVSCRYNLVPFSCILNASSVQEKWISSVRLELFVYFNCLSFPPKISDFCSYLKSGLQLWIRFNPYTPSIPVLGIGKQCRPRSDAAERGVWSGSSLFANRKSIRNRIKMKTYTRHT